MKLTKNQLDPDTGPVYIGNDTCCAGRFADATIDEVAIFSVALEEKDIQQMYEKGLEFAVLAVDPTDKMTTTWANVKVKY